MMKPTDEMIRMKNTHTMTRVWRARRVANSIPTMSERHDCMNLKLLLRASFSDETDETPSAIAWSCSSSGFNPSFSSTAASVCSLVAALMSLMTVSVKCAYERITVADLGNFSISHEYSAFASTTADSYLCTHATMLSICVGDGRPYATVPDFSFLSTRWKNFLIRERQFWCDLRATVILESNSIWLTACPATELTSTERARRMTA
mmetsp:Transcript_33213/g.75947  ORF Transcript_33213/g.75947 Transcript_33213/m.75947 type:complete len:206 (+) Transcript_33213:2021-2638(+)